MNTTVKNVLLWMVILVVILLLFKVVDYGKGATTTIGFSDFMDKVSKGEIDRVNIRGQEIRAFTKGTPEGREPNLRTYAPAYNDLVSDLRKANVKITAEEPREGSLLVILLQWAPILFLIGLWIFIMRQMQTGGNKAMSFGKSRAKLLTPSQKKVTFKDVAGVEEAKEELQEIIEFLKEPAEVPEARRQDPEGRPADRPSRHGQDASRARRRRRGERAVLLDLRLGLRRDVRRRRRVAASATSSSRARRTPPASSSSTRSTPSAATAARASAAGTTSASRR